MFAAARAGAASNGKTSSISLEMLTEHVRATVAKSDKRSADALAAHPPEDQTDLQERLQSADEELCILRNPADPLREEWVARATDRILAEAGGDPSDGDVLASLVDVVRRGLIELQRRKIDRYEDHHDRAFARQRTRRCS